MAFNEAEFGLQLSPEKRDHIIVSHHRLVHAGADEFEAAAFDKWFNKPRYPIEFVGEPEYDFVDPSQKRDHLPFGVFRVLRHDDDLYPLFLCRVEHDGSVGGGKSIARIANSSEDSMSRLIVANNFLLNNTFRLLENITREIDLLQLEMDWQPLLNPDAPTEA
ncbi:MAG: hypothetical protein JWO47_761 [Candidatus Saccharibacteria bacterium]|nr:hypothetical protein [Candidatus Saccharibacteria bacterium]